MKIQTKLIFSLLLLGMILCSTLYYLMQWSFDRGMIHYVNQNESENWQVTLKALASHYDKNQSWDNMVSDKNKFNDLIKNTSPEAQKRNKHCNPKKSTPNQIIDDCIPNKLNKHPHDKSEKKELPRNSKTYQKRQKTKPSLLNAKKKRIIGTKYPHEMMLPIKLNGKTVGWLAQKIPSTYLDNNNISITKNIKLAFAVLTLTLIFCALFIGMPLSRHFVKPLEEITHAANALTKGEYNFKSNTKRKDEIGSLAKDFEFLSATLKANEKSRSCWVANISHELRTPLSIVLGEINAILDSVRPLTNENLLSIKHEIDHLNHLVNDLYELSNAEVGALRYERTRMDIRHAVSHAAQRFDDLLAQKNIHIRVNIPDQPVFVYADVQRLGQLFNNLLQNELKYADASAHVHISLSVEASSAICIIEDSGPGVNDEQLNNLFHYLYRAESSRNRATGGSGLGLAICRNIVEAHGGKIESSHSPLGGLRIQINIPLII